MGSSKWKKITEAISQQGFSIQRLEVPIFEVTPGVIDFKNEIGIVKVLDNETLGELLSIANHSFSHGNEQGLYETWSKEQREKGEDPTGYLSEQEVIAQIQKLKKQKGARKNEREC